MNPRRPPAQCRSCAPGRPPASSPTIGATTRPRRPSWGSWTGTDEHARCVRSHRSVKHIGTIDVDLFPEDVGGVEREQRRGWRNKKCGRRLQTLIRRGARFSFEIPTNRRILLNRWKRLMHSLVRSPFFRGMARAVDISGALNGPNRYKGRDPRRSDADAWYRDWKALGDDFIHVEKHADTPRVRDGERRARGRSTGAGSA